MLSLCSPAISAREHMCVCGPQELRSRVRMYYDYVWTRHGTFDLDENVRP